MHVGGRKAEAEIEERGFIARRPARLFRLLTTGFRRLLLLVWLISAAVPAVAADGDPEITGLRVGFADRYKVGFWTPVEVTIKGGKDLLEGSLVLTVPDGDGVPTRLLSPPNKPVSLLPGQETTVPMFAKIGQIGPDISVRLFVGDDEKSGRTFSPSSGTLPMAIDTIRPMIITVGRPLGVVTSEGDDSQRSTVYATVTDASQFPTRWFGYEAADAVILCTSDPTIYRKLSPTSAQVAALDEWVRLGGRLILCVGSKAGDVLGTNSPLSGFAPGKFTGMVPLRRTNAWESYVETADRLDTEGQVDSEGDFRLEVPKLEQVRGRVEAFEGSRATDLPLVVRTPHGLGEIVFVAADLDRPPFLKWQARTLMLDRLLGKTRQQTVEATETAQPPSSNFGYNDMAGQLRSALEQFQGVKLVPFSLVAFLIVLYILAIGPFDYLLLKRGLKRMEWTWFTFPVLVLLFSGTAYFLAYWLKGDQLLTNQVDIVDYDASTKLVRGTTWSNIFSPRVDSYDLTYRLSLPDKSAIKDEKQLVSWMGLPGGGFGGMGAPTGGVSLFPGAYTFSPSLDALLGMPIAVWSTKGVTSRWSGEATSPILAELVDQGDKLLAGTLQSRLDEPLTDCVLVYDRWAYPIGTLDARTRISVEKKLDPQTVETYFKHISLFNEQDATSTYDPSTLQVERIVEAMMFHEHLGGGDYTRLSNQYQQFVDLSALLRCGRAILVGRGPTAGGQLLRDDKEPLKNAGDRRWTFYRFVFPVDTKDSAGR